MDINKEENNESKYVAKLDKGKAEISLVPTQIIRDIARVRMYGKNKYHAPNNWVLVEKERYKDAMMRHLLAYLDDENSIDEESGIPHYMHAVCNMAFLCEMARTDWDKVKQHLIDTDPILQEQIRKAISVPESKTYSTKVKVNTANENNKSGLTIADGSAKIWKDPDGNTPEFKTCTTKLLEANKPNKNGRIFKEESLKDSMKIPDDLVIIESLSITKGIRTNSKDTDEPKDYKELHEKYSNHIDERLKHPGIRDYVLDIDMNSIYNITNKDLHNFLFSTRGYCGEGSIIFVKCHNGEAAFMLDTLFDDEQNGLKMKTSTWHIIQTYRAKKN